MMLWFRPWKIPGEMVSLTGIRILFTSLLCVMAVLVYTSSFLRAVKPKMYLEPWKGLLSPDIKARILELGIKKVPLSQPYRRTRGRRGLFQHISKVSHSRYKVNKGQSGVNIDNLKPVETRTDRFKYNAMFVNSRSVLNKYLNLQTYIIDHNIDICGVTETWLPHDDLDVARLIPPPGYNIISAPRKTGNKGGGVAIIYRNHLNITLNKRVYQFDNMEYLELEWDLSEKKVYIMLIYRPPDGKVTDFIHELTSYIEVNIQRMEKTLYMGDFNINILDSINSDVINFKDFLSCFNLVNFINFATCKSGSGIDLCISDDDCIVTKARQGLLFSDHFAVELELCCSRTVTRIGKEIKYRAIKKIDNSVLKHRLQTIHLFDTNMDSCGLTTFYNKSLSSILDKVAPLKTKKIKHGPSSERPSWLDNTIKMEKVVMRRKERIWKRLKNQKSWEEFATQRKHFSLIVCKKVREYHQDIFKNCKTNYRDVYKHANKLLFRKEVTTFPVGDDAEIARNFNVFFGEKVERIMNYLNSLPTGVDDHLHIESEYITQIKFHCFVTITLQQTKELISSLATKSCELDPFPTHLIKSNLDDVIPIICLIINKSLKEGVFPGDLKIAIVRPLLKKAGLDANELKNFRPVSNLPFLGKIIEKAACNQIISHAMKTGNMEKYQSAYRRNRSTETALLDVMNNVYHEVDTGRVVCLIMLDLSAAFDTVIHDLLLNRLKYRFGVSGTVLSWLRSYLSNRKQKVVVNEMFSSDEFIKYGVPQGSILGPFLFTLFITPLGDICRKYDINFHGYADDQQLYCSFDPKDKLNINETVSRLEECILSIRAWMRVNRLKLNEDKTEVIMIGTKNNLKKVEDLRVKIGDDIIQPTKSVRNLGFYMGSSLTAREHINKLCSSSHFMLKRLFRVKHYIDIDTRKILSQALVMSRVDYCNSLLVGASQKELNCLQYIQNMCARFVTGLKKYDRISPSLKALHWLKIPYRIKYKILVITFKCIKGSAPEYLIDALKLRHNKQLRSATAGKLQIPVRCKLSLTLHGCFVQVAPRLWNALPQNLRNTNLSIELFKSGLKTHLFQLCYDC